MPRSPAANPDPYRELFERSADAILIIEGDRFVDCNEAAVRMLRCKSREEVLRTHPSEISPPTQPDGRSSYEKANECIDIAFTRGSHRFEWMHRRADGETFPVEVLLTAVTEGDRRTLHVVWRDLAERKLLEDSLRHAQKMDAVGKLAGGIAHDFNNLLVAILSQTDLLMRTINDPDAQRRLGQVRGAADRAADLVRQLLAFGRKQQLLPEVLNVATVVEELRPLMERLAGADLPIVVETPATPLHVEADRGQIEQVLMNLVSNARDATPGQGDVRIRVHRVDEPPAEEGEEGPLPPGSFAVVSVTDRGTGMPPEVAAKACDPFFTTKGQEGTGLGLATAYGIARQSGGTLRIQSAPGQGTTVHVYLPVTDKEPTHKEAPAPVEVGRGGGERVLVVEDEEVVRDVVLSALEEEGYQVRVARDGVEGREVFEQDPGGFDLIISDVVMPRATGPEMVEALEAAGHRPRVLFISGYTNDALTARQRLREGVDLVQKPFTARHLVGRVREILNAGAAR